MLDEVLLTQVGGRRGRMVGFLFVVGESVEAALRREVVCGS